MMIFPVLTILIKYYHIITVKKLNNLIYNIKIKIILTLKIKMRVKSIQKDYNFKIKTHLRKSKLFHRIIEILKTQKLLIMKRPTLIFNKIEPNFLKNKLYQI
jgi:hypothetical protein